MTTNGSPDDLLLEGEGPTLAEAQSGKFFLTLSATDHHIDPYADPEDWPPDPEPPWVRDPEWFGPGPNESARFRILLPEEARAAIAEHLEVTCARRVYHNWWQVDGAPAEGEPYTLVADEVMHFQDFAVPPAFVWRSERRQAELVEEDAMVQQLIDEEWGDSGCTARAVERGDDGERRRRQVEME